MEQQSFNIPEHKLMAGILKQAIIDARLTNKHGREAKEWFNSNDNHYLYDYLSICFELGLNPDDIRDRIIKLIERGSI